MRSELSKAVCKKPGDAWPVLSPKELLEPTFDNAGAVLIFPGFEYLMVAACWR